MFRLLIGIFFFGNLAITLIDLLHTPDLAKSWFSLLFSFGGNMLIAALVSTTILRFIFWIADVLTPIRITAEGLHGPLLSGFGNGFLSWAEMEKTHPLPLTRNLGTPFLVIRSFKKGRQALCIPLFLTRFPAFRQAVRDAASPLNPLRQSLENNGDAAIRIKQQSL